MLRHMQVICEREVNSSTSSQSRACGSRRCQPLKIVYLESFHPSSTRTTPLTQLLDWARSNSSLDNMESILKTIDNGEEDTNKISDKTEGSKELRAEELAKETYV